jgi:ligand-binding sensor domain-containing protein
MNCFYKWLSVLLCSGSFFIYGQPVITTYSSSNSPLPFNTVRCIAIQNQFKWFGTDDGLARFDGVNWSVYTTLNSPLLDDDIRAICVENDTIVWIGTVQGGLYSFDGLNWENYTPTNSGLPDYLVRGIAIDTQNNIWCATSEGIAMFDRVNWYTWNVLSHNLLTNNITAIAIGQQNEKFIGTINGGLNYFSSDNQLTILSIVQSGLPDNSALGIVVDATNHPWFATPAQGLVYDQGFGGPWLRFNMSNSPLPTNGINAIAIDENQSIFMGTDSYGVIIKNGDNWLQYSTENTDLPENYILSIATESTTVKWLGTYNSGVVRLEEDQSELFENTSNSYVYPTSLKAGDLIFISTPVSDKKIFVYNQLGQAINGFYLNNSQSIKTSSSCLPGMYYLKVPSINKIIRFIIE